MRRGLSIFLVVFFGLGPLSATLEAGDNSGLPACCRRNGAHHCAIAMQNSAAKPRAQSDSTPSASAPLTCPYYRGPAAAIISPAPALMTTVSGLRGLISSAYSHASRSAAPIANPIRAHAGRGPPAAKLS
jgi:hypothetical protein